jgi:putative oxidoreductase
MPPELTDGAAIAALVVGRILLGGFFVFAGVHHFPALTPISEAMRGRGVPFPRATLLFGTFWQIAFGALLIIGVVTMFAALALAAFVIAATIMMLNFWDHPPGPDREAAYRGFQTNVAILGGLLIVASLT